MSQVKFIQLGTITEPKRDYLVNDETKTEYKSSLEEARQKYPGAVIFTTFIKSATSKPKNEIYANGQLYSAGGSGSGAVYYGNIPVNADGAISETIQQPKKDGEGNPVMNAQGKPEMEEVTRTLQTLYPGAEVTKGTIYIYDPVDTDNRTDSEKENNVSALPSEGHVANCTAYYFDCEEGSEDRGKWVAFTGNVNAENVWFSTAIQRNQTWGCQAASTDGSLQTDEGTKNKNLREVLEYYLISELWPTNINVDYSNPQKTFAAEESSTNPAGITIYKTGDSKTTYDNNAEVLIGTPLTISGTYSIEARLTSTTPRNKTSDNTLLNEYTYNIGNKKISGMNYGYYKQQTRTNENGEPETYWDSTLYTGDYVGPSIPIKITYGSVNPGQCSSKLKWGTETLNQESTTMGSNNKYPDTGSIQTSSSAKKVVLGTTTISLDNSNGHTFSRSFQIGTVSDGTITYGSDTEGTTIPALTPIKYSNNKHTNSEELTVGKRGVSDSERNLAYTGTSVTFGNTTTGVTATDVSVNIIGYYPLYGNIGNNDTEKGVMKELTTRIKSSDNVVITVTTKWPDSEGHYFLEYPSTFKLSRISQGDYTYTTDDDIKKYSSITDGTTRTLGDGTTQSYKRFTDKLTYGKGGSFTITLSKI